MKPSIYSDLRSTFGDRLQENVPLSSYTAARIGGPADVLVLSTLRTSWHKRRRNCGRWMCPFILLGGGSNVLVSEKGVRGVVIINRARLVKFDSRS